MIRKYFTDIYVDITAIVLLTVFAVYRWEGFVYQIVGFCMAGVSFVFWILSRAQLGNSFSVKPQASHLITKGVYSKIRHPMYVFSSLVLLGLFIVINHLTLYVLWFILVVFQIIRSTKEDATLREKFGSEYDDYNRGVWF